MPAFKDLTGQKFGRLTVTSRAETGIEHGKRKRTRWNCVCDCGTTVVVNADTLTRGIQVSCGCYQREMMSRKMKTHGKTDTKLYTLWSGMKRRCYSESCKEYRYYGGRGIVMCDEWRDSFSAFESWALSNGYDETAVKGQCTIDRIDVNGIYSPYNCRFVDQQTQMNNVRSNHILEYNGERHTIAEWGRITGISPYKICNRVSRLGWTVERALETM